MEKKALYTYNPATDNFERFYPSIKTRLVKAGAILVSAAVWGTLLFVIFYFGLVNRSEEELREENSRLRSQYSVLERRVDASLKVMDHIRNRDDKFYRVMMQMDPMSVSQSYAGYDYEKSYAAMREMSDVALIDRLTRQVDLLDRQLYSQSQSFDQLRENALGQKDKMEHVPGVIPLHIKDYTMSSGYGVRRDPVYGTRKFHEGLDFAATTGTPVYATADGVVEVAERKGGYGNCIDIAHGYNYLTRYAHLSEILVKQGQNVKRGEMIGKVGSTGKSTGPHLHYEVRFKDEPQNPVNYYFLDLTPEEYAEMIQLAEDAGHVMD